MQPNSYYGFGMTPAQQSQSQPVAAANAAAKPAKKHSALGPISILLLLIIIGLVVFIVIDKMSKPSGPTTVVQADPNSITEPISSIELPADGEPHDIELAKALVGRTFVVDVTGAQTIDFTSNTDFVYTYFAEPSIDIRKVKPSTKNGKFTVKGNDITLSSGDAFRLENDYLIKTADDYSKNHDIIYFDLHQTKNVYNNINAALDSYIKTQIKATKKAIAADRISIDFGNFTCKVGDNHLTNADNYVCNASYNVYVTKDTADKIIADSQKPAKNEGEGDNVKQETDLLYKDFMSYCKYNTAEAEFSKDGICKEDYTIYANANIIVRISDGEYRITGLFH